ncbi:MAG: CBS domain-containing protein [Nitrospinae bacterium]|nr:CBS domain-containing protein [Nitrospinota bacterium]
MYVKNIMTKLSDLTVVYPDTVIKEAVNTMLSKGLTELPVVDKQNSFLGEISMRDIIGEALPSYVTNGNLKDVSFAPGLFKFEDKLKELTTKEVKSAMKKSIRTVTPEMSTFEVSTLLAVSEDRDEIIYAVEKDGKLAGAVSIASIFSKLVK